MKEIAIVILNWNGRKFLEKFLPSVVHNTDSFIAEIVVVDNDSTDDSVSFMKDRYPEIKLIQLEKNFGFAGGYYHALKLIKAKYFVLLNSDVEVTPNWLKPMYQFMESHDSVAACMPKILSYNAKNSFEHAGACGGFIDKYGYPFCRGRILDKVEKDQGQYNQIARVAWTTGACMMINAEMYHQAGGFDEDFFAHMEEIDLCWRLQLIGYELYCVPESKVYHVGGGSLPYNSPFKLYLNFRNNLFMLHKNLDKNQLWKVIIPRMILDGVAALMFLSKFQNKAFYSVIKAHVDYWKSIKLLNRKRKLVQKINNKMLISNFSLISRFYFYKRDTYSKLMN